MEILALYILKHMVKPCRFPRSYNRFEKKKKRHPPRNPPKTSIQTSRPRNPRGRAPRKQSVGRSDGKDTPVDVKKFTPFGTAFGRWLQCVGFRLLAFLDKKRGEKTKSRTKKRAHIVRVSGRFVERANCLRQVSAY